MDYDPLVPTERFRDEEDDAYPRAVDSYRTGVFCLFNMSPYLSLKFNPFPLLNRRADFL